MSKIKLKRKLQQGGSLGGGGGTYRGTEYLPFIQTPTNIQVPTYISKGNISEQQIQAPQLDLEELNKKLIGKGHTNDVNAYIESKVQAQQELNNLITMYGADAASLGDFSKLINKMQVNPNELNQLIVRREMSNEYADQNKTNGGQAEWVTSAEGKVFGQRPDGSYGYFDRVEIATGKIKPITSAEAIKLNDVDRALINDEDLMSKVAQTWGGSKAFKHVNENMSGLGKKEWLRAAERLGSVDKVGEALLYGEVGSETGHSDNAANIDSLYKSFIDSMDQSALNYFKNQALERVVQRDGKLSTEGLSEEELKKKANDYNYNTEMETRKLVWDYMRKALDVKDVSKQKVSYNAGYTKARTGGEGGFKPEGELDFLQFATTSGSFGEGLDSNGNLVIDSRRDDITKLNNGFRQFNADGSIRLVDGVSYEVRQDKSKGRLFAESQNGFLDVMGAQNLTFAQEPISFNNNAIGLPNQISINKYPKKDEQGNYAIESTARTYALVHASELKDQMVTVTGPDGKPKKTKLLADAGGFFSSAELSPEAIALGAQLIDDPEKFAISQNLDKAQTESLLRMASEASDEFVLMPVDKSIGMTTAFEYGQGQRPLMEKQNTLWEGQGYRSSLGGSTNTNSWATDLLNNLNN